MKNTKAYSSVIVTGSIAFDEIMDFPGKFVEYFHPEKLHQINVSFVVNKLEKQLGGIANNVAYNVSLVTKKPVTLLSAVGKDGSPFIEFYKKHSIDTTHVIQDSELFTSTGKVITDLNDNQIWGFYYGALEKSEKLDLHTVADKNTLVIISPTHVKGFLKMQNQSIKMKLDYIYDPGMAITWIDEKDLKEGIMNAKYLIANDYEVAQICRRLKMDVIDFINHDVTVITTLGEKGVQFHNKEINLQIPAFTLKKIVDPTGAGDAFRGGFIGGLLDGKNVEDCLKQGSALASFAIEKYGTVNHTPSNKELKERIRSI